jgi:hypothetical protein
VRPLALLALVLFGAAGIVTRVCVAAGEPECQGDYPVSVHEVDYRGEFAGGTLLPDEISLNAHTVRLRMTPGALVAVLGEPTRETAAPESRSALEQCQFLLRLLQEHRTWMHLYKLVALRLQNMAGVFRVSEWELPNVGTIKSFWYKPQQSGRELSYLYYFSPISIAPTNVERVKGEPYTLVRAGPPRMEWNIEKNRVSIAENQH